MEAGRYEVKKGGAVNHNRNRIVALLSTEPAFLIAPQRRGIIGKCLAEKPDWGGNRDGDSHYFRPHRSLEGSRPAESAGAVIPFESWRDVASMKGIE